MAVRVRNNLASLVAQNNLSNSQKQVERSIERLSSGLRINRASDDPAGIAVSERMRAKMASFDTARRNANDAISYLQTAEDGLQEVSNLVIRMNELATQSASDTLSERERTYLDNEFQQLGKEVGRLIEITEYNGTSLLDYEKSSENPRFYIGASSRLNAQGEAKELDAENDPDLITLDQSQLEKLNQGLASIIEGELYINTNSWDGDASELGPRGTDHLMSELESAMQSIQSYRSHLGAAQARLESVVTTIEVSNENLLASFSQIKDVDYASESAQFAQAKIRAAASSSMLTHANQLPEVALQLIRWS